MVKNGLFSSESVTEGHPDKVCDQISDGILDKILEQDPNARVACETLATTGTVYISGEITTSAEIDYEKVVLEILENIGYNSDFGVDLDNIKIIKSIDKQSPHIAQGVDKDNDKEQGAGDQGLMFGYACNETKELMPLPIQMAHHLTSLLTEVRKTGQLDWLGPDGKSQVTIAYKNNKPVKVKKIVIATQHRDLLDKFGNEQEEHKFISKSIIDNVILPVLDQYEIDYDNDFIVNGTGRFVVGGPVVDTGLTGRKIIVDTYGGYAKHGGGAFSGKDPSKVDRSAAYMARYIAKNVVASKLAKHCEVQLAYSIGVAEPVSFHIDTYGTGLINDDKIKDIIKSHFSLKPEQIIEQLNLKTPFYQSLSSYGHFGREDYPWESTDKVDQLKQMIEE
tara:strand:- start:597 stop:1772 length:1176 start_codon:yes stop_codon:yes gene_type:complete